MSSWKDNVRVATTGNIVPFPPTSLLTIDNVALMANDRVLVKDQTNASQNGIWVAANSAWTRATDANANDLLAPETTVRVSEGASNAHSEWVLANQGAITLGTTGLQFFQILSLNPYFIGPGEFHFSGWAITAGAGNDIFSTTNRLQDGQSDDPQAYLAASVAGYSFIGVGVRGRNGNGSALQSNGGAGVYGDSDTATGVYGSSNSGNGVWGQSNANQPAIRGYNNGPAGAAAPGVYGESAHWQGVYGISHSPGAGVHGANDSAGQGVWAESKNGDGLHAVSHSATAAGVSASNDGGGLAAAFQGNVTCFNDFSVLGAATVFHDLTVRGTATALVDVVVGSDCAEDFDVSSAVEVEAGTVMVLGERAILQPSAVAYDRKVVGVISGAGDYKPGLILGRREELLGRLPLALVGKVYCKADATEIAIEIGDPLTTSATPGHAMKASDPLQAFGAVIGKALAPLHKGRGLIPILVSLQ